MMKTSLKAIRFVIEALDRYQKDLDRQMEQEGLSEDDVSDLVNDRLYLEAIKREYEKYRDELGAQRENTTIEVC